MEDQKVRLRGNKKGFDGRGAKKKILSMSICVKSLFSSKENAQPLSKHLLSLSEEMGNHAAMTPTTTAAKAPRALKTFFDPPLLLPLVELEGFEPLEVLLGVPELAEPGVAEASG